VAGRTATERRGPKVGGSSIVPGRLRFDLGLAQRRDEAVAFPPELVQHQHDLSSTHAERSA